MAVVKSQEIWIRVENVYVRDWSKMSNRTRDLRVQVQKIYEIVPVGAEDIEDEEFKRTVERRNRDV